MKACTARGISNLPSIGHKSFYYGEMQSRSPRKVTLFAKHSNQGLRWNNTSSPMAAESEEKTSDKSFYVSDDEKEHIPVVKYAEATETKENNGSPFDEGSHKGSWLDRPKEMFKFMEDFDVKDIKVDYEEIYSILVFGGGGVVALWLAASFIKAIDSVPLFPKVLELVGLGYTIWFSYRYLIFKKNRDELRNKIEEFKLQVVGSNEEEK